MPTESSGETPQWIQELTDVEQSTDVTASHGILHLDSYFSAEAAEEAEQAPVGKEHADNSDHAKKMKSLKKDVKELSARVEALEEASELDLPESEDPVGALLSRLAMKDKKKTFKLIYGIVKEYAGSQNADPARIPVLFRELFEMCVTGEVKKNEP